MDKISLAVVLFFSSVAGYYIGILLCHFAHADSDLQSLIAPIQNCHLVNNTLPDRHCTPGATDPTISENNIHQTVCNLEYLASIKVPDFTSSILKSYHVSGNYTIDHLIPLVDGGSNSMKNMWPQPIYGKYNADDKDGLEALVHKQLCSGRITLSTAEHIWSNWIKVWKKEHMPRVNQTID